MPEPGTADSSSPQVARTCSLSQGEKTPVALGGERAEGVRMAWEEYRRVIRLVQTTLRDQDLRIDMSGMTYA